MRFQVNRVTKNHKLVSITTIIADRYETVGGEGFLGASSINFLIDEKSFFRGTKTTLIASLPGTDWLIQRV